MPIQNPEVDQLVRSQTGLTLSEWQGGNISSSFIPVIDVSPDFHKNIKMYSGNRSSSGSATVQTVSSTKKTYIVAATFSAIKDATNDTATGYWKVQVVINGVTTDLIRAPVLTTTAQTWNITVPFPMPILIDKGSNIVFGGDTYTVGLASRTLVVYYYETDY